MLMFDRQESLYERVGVVAKRFRAIRFWWSIAIIASIGSVVGVLLRGFVFDGAIKGIHAATLLLSASSLAAIVSFIAIRYSYRNPRSIALRIEGKFPALQQRLLTALSQPSPTMGKELGFLQRRVLSDTLSHSVTHRWAEAVPKPAAILSRLSGLLSLGIFALVVALLMLASPQKNASARSQLFKTPKVKIEPGDTEVEKSSGLVISARFSSADLLPESLHLLTIDTAGIEQEIPMARSLDDPILSAYIGAIEKPFRYRAIAPSWQSDEYSVEVFEFPKFVRADASLTYPTYTSMGTKTVEDTLRVSAVEGTEVKWLLWLNKPVEKIVIRSRSGIELEPTVVSDSLNQWQFNVTLLETDRWTVDLTDEKGRTNKHPITLDARALPNRIPDLKLVRGGDIVVSPLEEIVLAATVEDDFGIVRAGISYQLADGEPKDIDLVESVSRGTKQPLDHLVELERLNAVPDQLLSYHFWAEDIGPDGANRRTQSDLYFGEIRPFEEIFREGDSPAGGESPPKQGGSQQTEELTELQKQIISATWKISNNRSNADRIQTFVEDVKLLGDSQRQAIAMAEEMATTVEDADAKTLIQKMVGQMQEAAERLTEAATSVSKFPLREALTAEQTAYQILLQLRAREFQVSRSRQQQSQKSSGASSQRRQKQLDELELENDENRYETQSQATEENANDGQRENRQVLNRLKELAQRQEDINKQLAQLQSALEQAKDDEAKEEVRRQLKRLREQQQEMLREADELADRMQQTDNSESMSDDADKLAQTRENLRRSSEALEKNDAAQALSAGTRAERELNEMSEEFRKRAAGQFDDAVREMRSDARELEQAQQKLGEQIEQVTNNSEPGLRSGGDREAIEKTLKEQQAALSELMEKVQKTVEEAEPAEPLLAKDLYETYRKTQESQLDRQLSDTGELLRRGLDPQAQQVQRAAQTATGELTRNLEKAADSVLGNEEKALERALSELDRLEKAVSSEMNKATGGSPEEAGAAGASNDASESPPQESEAQSKSQGNGNKSEGSGKPAEGQSPGTGGMLEQMGEGAGSAASPITGGGFREFSDGLRDIEEMVGEPALRSEAAAIRDRTRQMRLELKRHSEQPKWALVESMIAKPLRELKMKVSEELVRRSAERTAPVPIDRDPVPKEFSGAVRRYYESLGSGR